MRKNLEYITILINKFGIKYAKENYLDTCICKLDKFAKKYNSDYIFHLTVNEFNLKNDTIKFMIIHKEKASGLVKEIIEYLLITMQIEKFKFPYQLLSEFFDESIPKISNKG